MVVKEVLAVTLEPEPFWVRLSWYAEPKISMLLLAKAGQWQSCMVARIFLQSTFSARRAFRESSSCQSETLLLVQGKYVPMQFIRRSLLQLPLAQRGAKRTKTSLGGPYNSPFWQLQIDTQRGRLVFHRSVSRTLQHDSSRLISEQQFLQGWTLTCFPCNRLPHDPTIIGSQEYSHFSTYFNLSWAENCVIPQFVTLV
jgi:hypothetical protein